VFLVLRSHRAQLLIFGDEGMEAQRMKEQLHSLAVALQKVPAFRLNSLSCPFCVLWRAVTTTFFSLIPLKGNMSFKLRIHTA
jgi:hypothetical protein